jgi:mRNA interferase MazF
MYALSIENDFMNSKTQSELERVVARRSTSRQIQPSQSGWGHQYVLQVDERMIQYMITRFSTVICAPVYTAYEGLTTQVQIGTTEGMKHDCSIHCDEIVSIPKSMLSDFIGTLPQEKMLLLDEALRTALELHND